GRSQWCATIAVEAAVPAALRKSRTRHACHHRCCSRFAMRSGRVARRATAIAQRKNGPVRAQVRAVLLARRSIAEAACSMLKKLSAKPSGFSIARRSGRSTNQNGLFDFFRLNVLGENETTVFRILADREKRSWSI